ncbi:MAG TPA: DegT/DnrJ/EryC1/StrS family aminotransferase [Afifellaceae bacterium]|nr:DegT/DnrJ/EryC1/StrS family aminotransferase [Afifellaceae bacterium]
MTVGIAGADKQQTAEAGCPKPAVQGTIIDLFGIQRQTERLRPAIDERLAGVLDHGQFVLGPEVTELEARIADFVGNSHVVTVSSGRDALVIALLAEGIGRGDAVFVPAFTFSASAEAVTSCGATPIFVDVDPDTFNMDADCLEKTVRTVEGQSSLRARAVVAVDIFGLPADYRLIREVADTHELFLVADAAQSFGGEMDGDKVGSLAPVTAFSFYPTKPLGGFGDGGALVCADRERAEHYRRLRLNGRGQSGLQETEAGLSARLDTVQAAFLLCKLADFEEELARRREIASRYGKLPADTVSPQKIPNGFESAFALYSVQCRNRDKLMKRLGEAGIMSRVYYPAPLHLHPAFRKYGFAEGDMPVSELLCSRILSLPMHAYLADEEVDRICEAIRSAEL